MILPLLGLTLLAVPAPGAGGTGPGHLDESRPAAVRESRAAAARRYLEAAAAIPSLSEWLIRRSALNTGDSLARQELYQRIHSPVVLARLLETEAQARENAGDLIGAAVRYDSLGRVVDATRLRLAFTRPGLRAALRDTLVAFASRRAGTPDVAGAIDLISSTRLPTTAAQALILARAAGRSRLASRAVPLYQRALRAGVAQSSDRVAYAVALSQLGRHREAITALTQVPASDPSWPEATYYRAQAYNRLGQQAVALKLLARLFETPDSVTAGRALFSAGEIRWRANQDSAARVAWLSLVRRFPANDNAPRAAFLAGLVQFENGRRQEAAVEWEQAHLMFAGQEGLASGYWAGRAFDEVGQRRRAEGLWQSVIARDSVSYYAVASFKRLGLDPWSPSAVPDRFESYADLDSAGSRMAMLRSLSMTQEVQWERDWLLADGRRQPERLLATADLFRRDGQPAAAVQLARRALSAGAPADARTYRLIYPLLHQDELKAQAVAAGVDRSVIAALIRQESIWESQARSRAGAIGLMQVMPATGREIARALKVSNWTAEALLDPATNIRFGTYHLSAILRRFEGDLTRALAAYNAGASRVPTWNSRNDPTDPELFIERIGFQETRDYVRIIQRNLTLYRALYGG